MSHKICVIGLGYVGLPLAVEFSRKSFEVVGYDISKKRVIELLNGEDFTLEVKPEDLKEALESDKPICFTSDEKKIADCSIYIITVPTPVTKTNIPDLQPLNQASELVGRVLSKDNIVIYESTVYPGCTEEECVPILEKKSGLTYNKDFFCGYSPERINPGDKEHTLTKVKKVTAGSTKKIAEFINSLYSKIIDAGTHLAPSIKVAEAAKVIENAQRDINIAFVNELSKIFNKLNIDTHSVLEVAGTKWNFLKFEPGLVGGHCIGVDPYYLAQKAQMAGYHPEIILAGRKINDSMGEFIANEVIKKMIQHEISIINSEVLLLGFTFKENCPDIRNTRVIDVYKTFEKLNVYLTVFDPWASKEEVLMNYGIEILNEMPDKKFDSIIHLVCHEEFRTLDFNKIKKEKCLIYDVKSILPKSLINGRL